LSWWASTGRGPARRFARALGVTEQVVSQTVDVLVRRGYLERQADPADRRRSLLELTERGRQLVEAVLAGIDEVDRQLAEEISREDS